MVQLVYTPISTLAHRHDSGNLLVLCQLLHSLQQNPCDSSIEILPHLVSMCGSFRRHCEPWVWVNRGSTRAVRGGSSAGWRRAWSMCNRRRGLYLRVRTKHRLGSQLRCKATTYCGLVRWRIRHDNVSLRGACRRLCGLCGLHDCGQFISGRRLRRVYRTVFFHNLVRHVGPRLVSMKLWSICLRSSSPHCLRPGEHRVPCAY
jgi:hypothetical protein